MLQSTKTFAPLVLEPPKNITGSSTMRSSLFQMCETGLRSYLRRTSGTGELAASAAYEIQTGNVNFDGPPPTGSLQKGLRLGEHFPIQACLYVEHRARLYIIKSLVDYWLAKQRGELEARQNGVLKVGGKVVWTAPDALTSAMTASLDELSAAKSFRLFPVFWQVFLWSWGGFLTLEDCIREFAALEEETRVPVAEIPIALSVFDRIFPITNGWFRELDLRKVLILTPPPCGESARTGVNCARESRTTESFGIAPTRRNHGSPTTTTP